MKTFLSRPEKKLRESYEKREWKSLGKKTSRVYADLARRQIKQERVNIRLSSTVLQKLRQDAEATGLPYQTLIASVLYRYARGKLHDEQHLLEAIRMLKKAA